MAMFIEKPHIIQAVQFDPDAPWPEGVEIADAPTVTYLNIHGTPPWRVGDPVMHLMDSTVLVSPGDWIITDEDGFRRLCPPGRFKETCKPIDDVIIWHTQTKSGQLVTNVKLVPNAKP